MEERDLPTAAPTAHQRPDVASARHDAEREARAEEICSRLLIERWVPKRAYRDLLLDDDLRAAVARRLGMVGLELVESFTSDWFAVRLKRSIEGDISFDWATNARLPRGAVALLVVLWAKLVLPKRLDPTETAVPSLPDASTGATPGRPEPSPAPAIGRDQLYAEFGRKFGKTAFARYVGQLKSAGFVREDRAGNLREGPLLDLLVDGVQMAQKLRDSVLWDVLDKGVADVAEGADEAGDTDSDEFGE
ncbi:MAG: hypothetical protein FJ100_05875 [Deltaproteobacteria bacterium]|nr:hypothetical protein [Deltaproteobacteria bacterium]